MAHLFLLEFRVTVGLYSRLGEAGDSESALTATGPTGISYEGSQEKRLAGNRGVVCVCVIERFWNGGAYAGISPDRISIGLN